MGKIRKFVKDEQLFLLIRNFLLTYLPVQRKSSENTIKVYRTVLNQFLRFAANEKGITVPNVTFELFNYDMVNAYLDSLSGQGFSPATRNNRLAALKAFISYASAGFPEYIYAARKIAAIKAQKDDPFSKVDYMSEQAVQAILEQPDASTRIGLRDQVMMVFFYDTGARIQEVLDVRICDMRLGQVPQVILHGKGGKSRSVPLMKDTVNHIRHYMSIFHENEPATSTKHLFYSQRKGSQKPICDDTVRLMMQKYADSARKKCPSVPVRVHPHLWRHTRAMHLYQHGMDLTTISQWLGHVNVETTLVYAYADTEHKRMAITRALGENAAPAIGQSNYTVTDEELLRRLYGL